MLRAAFAALAVSCVLVDAQAQSPSVVPDADAPQAVETARVAVEAHRARLEREIAELVAVVEAQGALVAFVESGGAGEDDGLDRRLCRGATLQSLQ